MEVYTGLDFTMTDSSVSLGKFDGVHQGHRLLLEEITRYPGLAPTVFTFESDADSEKIYTQTEKDSILERLGIEREVIFPFNEETKKMLPEDFIREILVKRMGVRHICVGTDFRFGKNRAGDISTLERYSRQYGYTFTAMEKKKKDSRQISSTWVRSLMEEGNIGQLNALLGEPYFIRGTVLHGNALGGRMQMPTANIAAPKGKKLLPFGVYATIAKYDQKQYFAVTNIGKKPTVGDFAVGIETYLMDFTGDLYGQEIQLTFYQYLRPEKRFETLALLRQQMERDKENAREILVHRLPNSSTLDVE